MALKCILIEDCSFLTEIYRLIINSISHIELIAEATNGKSGSQLIHELKPDLVLLDLVLPEKNGFDVLSECAHLKSKFIIISSLSKIEFESKAKSLGALFYIEKPFKKNELIECIELVLSKYNEVSYG